MWSTDAQSSVSRQLLHPYCWLMKTKSTWPCGNTKKRHLDDRSLWSQKVQLISYQFQKQDWNLSGWNMNSQAAHVRNVQSSMVCTPTLGLHLCGSNTHDEFQYILLNINYESPALLVMHQLRRGKLRHTVQRVHEAEKELIQHMKSVSVACCVCVQTCGGGGRRYRNVLLSS